MIGEVIREIFIPLLGTVLGAGCVFFLKGKMNKTLERSLTGFAAGVMVAASVWSLIIPSIEHSADMGAFSFVPAVVGFWIGVLFLLILDKVIPHLHRNANETEGPKSKLTRSSMLVLAVALHNLPEGMAVGAVLAGAMHGDMAVSGAGALALSIGIAVQNFPEGAIISLPLIADGQSNLRSFFFGAASGIVEPIAALVTIAFSAVIMPVLSYLLAFAAGAMIYVVVEELIPESQDGEHSNIATVGVMLGFAIMMVLDMALG